MKNSKDIKKFYNTFEQQKNRGVVSNVDPANIDTAAYQYGRDLGRESTFQKAQRQRKLDSVKLRSDNYPNGKSPSETEYGQKRYDEGEYETEKAVVDDLNAEDFYNYVHNELNKADPIRHAWLLETYPQFFDRQEIKMKENCEAYIYHNLRTIFPASTKQDFYYEYLLAKGMPPPNLHFWKIVQPTGVDLHNTNSRKGNTKTVTQDMAITPDNNVIVGFQNEARDYKGVRHTMFPLFPQKVQESPYLFSRFLADQPLSELTFVKDGRLRQNDKGHPNIQI